MGVVYLAHDELLDRQVAVKFIPTIDDDALTRFLVEARAAARLQHPNVATLYRVGQLEDRPYLIYEHVRGTSLDRLPRPVDPAEVLRIGIDLARGLAAAHRRGVLHRDIKPGNAMLAETGEAKLLDFGVAKLVGDAIPEPAPAGTLTADDEASLRDLTQGQLLGTPYFMSPEAWRRQATEQSDVYSLGLVLYELAAGKGPYRDVPLPELPRAVLDRDARPLRAAAPAVPEGLAAVVDRCLRRDPRERFASAGDLLAALEALRPARAARVPEGNPYRGLRPFEPEHRALFFGRQRALSQALDRLRVEPLLVVTGDSGVGKSSICAAGILPLVSEGALEDGRAWAVARLVPGRAPVVALAAALAPVVGAAEDEIERAIRDDPGELGRLARRRLREGDGLLVYVDQLEELVTLAAPAEAAPVSDALGALGAGLPGVRVLATARADFLSRLEALPGLAGRVSRALMLLAPLARDEVREAIVGPAEVKQTRFESEAMIDGLVDATAEGAMPLLQFALAELWERRDAASGVIPAAALEALGGVGGALSRHADAVLATLLPAERVAARSLLLRLVTAERTRARRLEDELLGTSPHARPALDALVRGRLVVAGDGPEGTTYEIAHEALLEAWDTLARWLAEEAETRAMLHRLEAAAAEWRRRGGRKDLLWGARQLAEAGAIADEDLTARERAFLAASEAAARRARWVRRGAAIAVLVAIVAVWAGVRMKVRLDRDREIRAELDDGAARLVEARRLDDELEAARAASFAATGEDAEAAWRRAVELRPRVLAAYRAATAPVERALLLDADRADVRARFAEVLFERATIAEREHQLEERDELIDRVALYAPELLARWRAPARLALATTPPGAAVLSGDRTLGATPVTLELPPGSTTLELRAPGRVPVTYPVLLARGETLAAEVPLPAEVPEGFVYVPPGRTLVGSGDPESVRTFFKAVPQRPVSVGAFLIARHETTFAEWIAYLEALPPAERARRAPGAGEGGAQARGSVRLDRRGDGRWQLTMQPGDAVLRAAAGEPIRYPNRDRNAEQDWLRMPVVGISFEDAKAFAAWRGARLCTEHEWERAARGADGRAFPHGDTIAPEDANFDETYGKRSFGPDEVGSHPRSRSPFGVDDLAGNVWEWVAVDATATQAAARGGSFSYAATTARIANRETPPPSYRDISLGMRLCATPVEE